MNCTSRSKHFESVFIFMHRPEDRAGHEHTTVLATEYHTANRNNSNNRFREKRGSEFRAMWVFK